MQKLREIFESVDANGDGAISKKDCRQHLPTGKRAGAAIRINSTPPLKKALILVDLNA